MDVVFHPADLVHEDLVLLANPSEVCPRPWLFLFGDELQAVFCAENNVQKILDCCVRQMGLSSGANILRRLSNFVSRLKALGLIF